jgi:hypothetical protein
MKRSLLAAAVFVLARTVQIASVATICPATSNTNSDCAFILTIGSGGSISVSAMAGANPYDGADDALIGVINSSGSVYSGTMHLSSGAAIFSFENDGICTFIGPGGFEPSPAGTYCTPDQVNGTDPDDYAGPLNTFVNVSGDGTSGDVSITGLSSRLTTFFSLEGSPADIAAAGGISATPGAVPEPATVYMFGGGLLAVCVFARRRLRQG